MGAFKLETFKATASGGLDGIHGEVLERARNEAYAQGFKDGVDVTSTAVDAEKNQRLAVIEAALGELHVTHEVAARSIEASLAPLIGAFMRTTAPNLFDADLLKSICEQVETAYKSSNRAALSVVAAPELVDGLRQELQFRGLNVEVDTDGHTHSAQAAEIKWAGGVDVISMNAALDELNAQILAHISQFTQGNADDPD